MARSEFDEFDDELASPGDERPEDTGLAPAHEYEPPPTADELLAEEQAALEAERDATDAIARFNEVVGERTDPHEDEARALGFRLLWWRDTSLIESHRAMGVLFDQCLRQQDLVKELRSVGLPEDTLTETFSFNMESGPLVMAGLQLLGLHLPEVRPQLTKILALFEEPTPTEAEIDTFKEAYEKLAEARVARAEQSLRDAGYDVRRPEDMTLGDEPGDVGPDLEPDEGFNPGLN